MRNKEEEGTEEWKEWDAWRRVRTKRWWMRRKRRREVRDCVRERAEDEVGRADVLLEGTVHLVVAVVAAVLLHSQGVQVVVAVHAVVVAAVVVQDRDDGGDGGDADDEEGGYGRASFRHPRLRQQHPSHDPTSPCCWCYDS